jgi:hypothetical protein
MQDDRAAERRLIDELLRRHSVRPAYRRHVQSVLRFCASDAEMEDAINSLYRQTATRRWFF